MTFIFALGSMTFLVTLWRMLSRFPVVSRSCKTIRIGWRRVIFAVSPALFARYRFIWKKGRWPHFRHPRTFDEKLLWLMIYWRHPLKSRCGDKYEMRSYARELGLGHLLPELYGVYRDSREIDFEKLPDRFVLKGTHGCGFNIIVANKAGLDIARARKTLDAWMKTDFSVVYGELQYASMKRRIICERFLGEKSELLPHDYKVFCFHGRVHCTMVCTERVADGVSAIYHYYDREWRHRLAYDKTSAAVTTDIAKPDGYQEMIDAAERLSKPFPFVRVDFYSIAGRAVLGEMTFTPAGCIDTDSTDLAQRVLGGLIELPPKLLK